MSQPTHAGLGESLGYRSPRASAPRRGRHVPNRPLLVEIGAAIRRNRVEQGSSIKMLAEASGLSISAVSQIECGRCAPTVRTLLRIADSLGVEIVELLGDL
jgi:ribosome-binding protein aMBF1 (putative translation factor)